MTAAMSQILTPSLGLVKDKVKSESFSKKSMSKQKDAKRLNLKVIENPINTFYKDEGGKSNHLTAKAVLVVRGAESTRVNVGNISINPKLIYEDGREVEDADEIFTLLEIEPRYLTSTNEPIVLKYRVEKVSRRKDGKKFQVRFEVDARKSKVLRDYSLAGIENAVTSAVVVLSKRKNSFTGKSQGNGSKNASKRRNVPKKTEKMVEFTAKDWKSIKNTIAGMKDTITTLTERLTRLENERKHRVDGDHDRADNLLMRMSSNESAYPLLNSTAKCRPSGRNMYVQPMEIFPDELEDAQKNPFDFDDPEGLFVQF